MSMYKRILVPLDGSGRAEAIIPHVEYLARTCPAQVLFLQVNDAMPVLAGSHETQALTYDTRALEARQQEIDRYLAGWEGEFRQKGIEARRVVAQGAVVETIIDIANREDVDLIAMASHGRSGLRRVFYGSIAAGVLQRVDRPLLLVRAMEAEDSGREGGR